jgi:hypothetical protein
LEQVASENVEKLPLLKSLKSMLGWKVYTELPFMEVLEKRSIKAILLQVALVRMDTSRQKVSGHV